MTGEISATTLYTTADVAGMLNVSQGTVRQLYRTGKLRGVKLDYRTLRFRAHDLQNFMQENEDSQDETLAEAMDRDTARPQVAES